VSLYTYQVQQKRGLKQQYKDVLRLRKHVFHYAFFPVSNLSFVISLLRNPKQQSLRQRSANENTILCYKVSKQPGYHSLQRLHTATAYRRRSNGKQGKLRNAKFHDIHSSLYLLKMNISNRIRWARWCTG
jgi:hypothetical protein